jgi:hypothetical protein
MKGIYFSLFARATLAAGLSWLFHMDNASFAIYFAKKMFLKISLIFSNLILSDFYFV